jgi:type IV pilus assembly protein PilY1
MNRIVNTIIAAAVMILLWSPTASATPDQFTGDNAIYTGSEVDIQPNVLIIFDTSGSMSENATGGNYVATTVYSSAGNYCGGVVGGNAPCLQTKVYECTHFGADECDTWSLVDDNSKTSTSCESTNPKSILGGTAGQWIGVSHKLVAGGGCSSASGGTFALGNYINWSHVLGPPRSKIVIAKDVVTDLINATQGVSFGLMRFVSTTAGGRTANEGGQLLNATVYSKAYATTIKNMLPIHNGIYTNRQALTAIINSTQLTANGYTPLAETLYEAYRYFSGQTPYFGKGIAGTTDSLGNYISPIVAGCQKNYIIIITDGMSTEDRSSVLRTICTTAQGYPTNGDCDKDGFEPYNDPVKDYSSNGSDYLNDVARFLHDSDMAPGYAGKQNVITYTIGFGLGTSNAGAVKLLNETAKQGDLDNVNAHAYLAENAGDLSNALADIFGTIAEVNSSFVAPVVPVSPENKIYSGSRVYLGFFKPIARHPWYGNLKKFGFDDSTNLIDKNGKYANFVDLNGDMRDDRDNYDMTKQAGAKHGSFRDSSTSYWSTVPDGGTVESGGVGGVLLARNFATLPRLIYTYQVGNTTDLTAAVNRFNTTNMTPAILSVATTTERDNIVNFMYGADVYDQNGNNNKTEKRANSILGDILHSKPLIINYATYSQTGTNESNCAVNKTMLFVGANDGMLHAFKDCDGSEAWAFIPPNALPNLQYFDDVTHTYYMDSSPAAYIYDANGNQTIDAGDRVILVVGQRRGGGAMALPGAGWYYALDVTNFAKPVLLWQLGPSTAGFAEMGETFSEPKIVKTKISDGDRMVLFVGAGYDNCNEDGRFGSTQTFPGTCNTLLAAGDDGPPPTTSAGAAAPITPRGRGIFAIEVAKLDASGVPSFGTSGTLIWSKTAATQADFTFSIASELAAVDTNYDTYVDLLYAADTGGNLWRFDVSDTATTNWSAKKLFSTNPGYSNGVLEASTVGNGKKVFYKPSVILEPDSQMIFFGTGDRDHPLNRSVTDRLYAFIDRGQNVIKTEANLVDVTEDKLQAGTATDVTSTLNALADASKYGWYIRLNQNSGEKVLASPLVMNKVAYFTTYSPDTVASTDPCVGGNLGTGRVYLLNYQTGEAVRNLDTSNDSQFNTYKTNERAAPADGVVLLRSDRVQNMGSGIPSGVVPVTSKTGDTTILVGCGGGICQEDTTTGVSLIYWRQK